MKKDILGNYLRNLREQHGVTQPVLAEQMGISTAFINYIELGKRKPSIATLNKYSEYFKVGMEHLKDLLEKQKLLNKETEDDSETLEIPESIQKLLDLLIRVDKPLLDKLVTSFMEQVNEHLIQMTANFTVSDLRANYKKVLAFDNNHDDPIIMEGFLKLPEDSQLFFKFVRIDQALTLELLQTDRSKIDIFEKWIGPHVYSNLCEITVPHVLEKQKGVSFTWFSPSNTLQEQYDYLLKQKVSIDFVLFSSSQLAWFVQHNRQNLEHESEV